MSKFIPDLVIDGALGEGGGSILRLSIGLACALKKTIEIKNIRANRKKPGLRLQHLVGVETLTTITGGAVNDLKIGSTNVRFSPGDKWIDDITIPYMQYYRARSELISEGQENGPKPLEIQIITTLFIHHVRQENLSLAANCSPK